MVASLAGYFLEVAALNLWTRSPSSKATKGQRKKPYLLFFFTERGKIGIGLRIR